ncbi:acyl carrier protein [Arthrobacter sp. Y-9]|uniref:acyl carrier protein n=1 Tax=Arthrobacter sp. Y-9 TaxID=3039385 RepID=UPI00241DBFB4|nr:acyl carrier protein [Arthrobacter sp. Y-9]WFR83468.1 acyl carrier protein [Arthrobacter sp. Y-9]
MPTIHDSFLTILTEKFGVPVEETANASSTMDDLGLDSLALVEMLLDVQKSFGATIETGIILPHHTIDQVVNLIAERAGASR